MWPAYHAGVPLEVLSGTILNAADEVAVAKWWACEGTHRVVHATQHLHGGVGADVDYPIHRYFLWGKQTGDALGAGSWQLTRLGALIAEEARSA